MILRGQRTQVGFIVLIGLAAEERRPTAIVEFAREGWTQSLGTATEAARLRMRPILMMSSALTSASCGEFGPWAPVRSCGRRSGRRCSPA